MSISLIFWNLFQVIIWMYTWIDQISQDTNALLGVIFYHLFASEPHSGSFLALQTKTFEI